MAVNNDGYFSRSFALLKKDKGWEKPVLVLAAAALVPVVGFLGVQGYALEWARLTAWGVDAAPKQKDVRIGECIKSGWRGFLGGAAYVIVAVLINGLLTTLFGDNSLTKLLGYLTLVVASVLYVIGALRATIYQDFTAGYRLDRIRDMVTRDFEGITRITLINVVMSLVASAVAALLSTLVLMPVLVSWVMSIDEPQLEMLELEYLDGPTMRFIFFGFVDAIASAAPWLAIIFFMVVLCMTFQQLIVTTAVGFWMRNFNVPAWGASEDPLPAAGSYVPAQGYGYQQDQSWGESVPYGETTDTAFAQDVYTQPTNSNYIPPEYAQPAEPRPTTVDTTPVVDEPPVVQPIVVPVVEGWANATEDVPAATEANGQDESGDEPFVMRDVWETTKQEAAATDTATRDVIEVISLTDIAPEVSHEIDEEPDVLETTDELVVPIVQPISLFDEETPVADEASAVDETPAAHEASAADEEPATAQAEADEPIAEEPATQPVPEEPAAEPSTEVEQTRQDETESDE